MNAKELVEKLNEMIAAVEDREVIIVYDCGRACASIKDICIDQECDGNTCIAINTQQ